MKYIRTKDGRIIDCRFSKKEYERDFPNSEVSYERWFELAFETDTDYEFLKQSDTIEELCDVLVCIDKITGCHTIWKVIDKYDLILEDYDWYGAIWTEKGLIYVAKMNEKGKLELL